MRLDFNYKIDFEKILKIEEPMKINEKTVLMIVDMNNGFAKNGALYSERVESIIPNIVEVTEKFISLNNPIIAFTDTHTESSPEFLSYPVHCLENTYECELVDELKVFENKISIIPKNSTNAFLEDKTFKKVNELIEDKVENFVIVGCCTDICIYQLAVSMKTYFNKINKDLNVIVPINCVETYDAPYHNANAMNLFALTSLQSNGIILSEYII